MRSDVIVGGIIEKDSKFLLVQEAKKRCRGMWNFPAGHLDIGETIFEGAIREINEETGCKVKLNGILEIGNVVMEERIFLSIIFSTELIEENIKYDKNEILDVKWFTYEEIIGMKNNLRGHEHILNVINTYRENKVADINTIKIIKE